MNTKACKEFNPWIKEGRRTWSDTEKQYLDNDLTGMVCQTQK